MAKFYFIAFAVTSLLPAFCNGSFCRRGKLERSQIHEYVLNPVNEARQRLSAGKQKNGLGGKNLPAAKGMTKLAWSCALEKIAIETLNGRCMYKEDPTDEDGRATLFQQYDLVFLFLLCFIPLVANASSLLGYGFGDPIDAGIIKTIFQNDLNYINIFALDGVTPRKVVYKKKTPQALQKFVNMIRPKATKIGCAFVKCNKPQDPYAVYCVMNAKKLNDGDVIYEA
ncbi:SCP-like protein [Ancylostoma caninum]|uniref:SCP-like protein n=1 Tax=Ancylostoma caninum TaxID=29170 RepID=A0A368H9A9_ANCCA|nr:SCP-like protein [Ancylostoma caninum]